MPRRPELAMAAGRERIVCDILRYLLRYRKNRKPQPILFSLGADVLRYRKKQNKNRKIASLSLSSLAGNIQRGSGRDLSFSPSECPPLVFIFV